ncbi:MAG: rod shape-determining protein MreC [Chitinophagaceae bacterium]|nr:rod shape-determining protein MreC [Chitinophagaceae bacterium]
MKTTLHVTKKREQSFVFLLLLFLSFLFIFSRESIIRSHYYNGVLTSTSQIKSTLSSFTHYISLKKKNREILEENAFLKQQLLQYSQEHKEDSAIIQTIPFEIIPARIINKTVLWVNNYITIDVGENQGVTKGMGVITENSIVGQVINTSRNFSIVLPVLHIKTLISAVLKKSKVIGTIHWDGKDPRYVKLLYVPRHVEVKENDTILTSGYGYIYPRNYIIGTVHTYTLPKGEIFYDIIVELSTNFYTLDNVYVMKHGLKSKADSIGGF